MLAVDLQASSVESHLARWARYSPRLLVTSRRAAIVTFEGPGVYDLTDRDDPWPVAARDLALVSSSSPTEGDSVFGETPNSPAGHHHAPDWRQSGTLWPVLCAVSESSDRGDDDLRFHVNWDYALFDAGSAEVLGVALSITAVTWARCRALKWSAQEAGAFVDALADDGGTLSDNAVSILRLRRQMIADTVSLDPRLERSRQFEIDLLKGLYEAWQVNQIEAAAREAVDASTLLYQEHSRQALQKETERQTSVARRFQIVLLVLTVVSGMSALTSIADFMGNVDPWKAHLFPRGVIALGVTILAVTALVLSRDALRARRVSSDLSGE